MEAKESDGISLRVHLQRAAAVGKVDPLLEVAPLSPCIALLWQVFIELSATRTAGMGANPISHVEIESWCRLYGVRLTPWEVTTLKAVDSALMGEWAKEKKP